MAEVTGILPTEYRMSFTAASLRPELARVCAEAYFETGSWAGARKSVLEANSFQCRSRTSLQRLEREMRQRVACLNDEELTLLATGTSDERIAMSWLAVLKHVALVREFVIETLREKLEAFDTDLRPSDYDSFIAARSVTHPELVELKESTREKIQQVLLRMLMEAGLTQEQDGRRRIVRPVGSPEVTNVIVADDPRLLAGFLWTDEEIQAIKKDNS